MLLLVRWPLRNVVGVARSGREGKEGYQSGKGRSVREGKSLNGLSREMGEKERRVF